MTPPLATLLASGQIRVVVNDAADSNLIRSIPGRIWHKGGYGSQSAWLIPGTPEAVSMLRALVPSATIPQQVALHVVEMAAWRKRVEHANGEGGAYGWPDDLIDATPYQHQVDAHRVGLTVLEQSQAFGLWHDAGLGKTLTNLAIVGDLAVAGKLGEHPVMLVVCPSVVIGVWTREAEKFAKYPIRAVPLVGTAVKRAALILATLMQPFDGVTMFVTNYEILWRKELLPTLLKMSPHVMICDEAHRLKSPGSEQSKAARKIGAHSIRIAATGTPTDKPEDWYGIFRWLDPSVFGASYTAFKSRYFITVPSGDGFDFIIGPKPEMEAELYAKANSIAHACSKDEALDLPERIDIDRTCELEPKARRAYEDLRKDAISILEDGSAVVGQNALTRLLRLQQITGGYLKKSEDEGGGVVQVSEAKLTLLREELIDQLPSNHKIVIFARFTAEIDAIMRVCRSRGIGVEPSLIDGRVPIGPQRDAIIDRFQNSDEKQILVLQTQAGGIGITLHASHLAIFYSLGSSLIDWSQARDRIHRIGQEHKCTYINLVCEGTVDEKVLKVLRSKQDVSKLSLHQWKELLS